MPSAGASRSSPTSNLKTTPMSGGCIDRIILPLGLHMDAKTPYVDARLPDGSRVNAVIPPVAIAGGCITIRKFGHKRLTMEDLIKFGALTKPLADFLKGCVLARLNIIVAGGTGSGKTTLLNLLSGFIPADERIVTIEDAAELRLRKTTSYHSNPRSRTVRAKAK